MNRKDLLEMGLAFLVGSGLMFGIQKKVESEFRNFYSDGYNSIMSIMEPIAESLGNIEQIPRQDTKQPAIYLVDSKKY